MGKDEVNDTTPSETALAEGESGVRQEPDAVVQRRKPTATREWALWLRILVAAGMITVLAAPLWIFRESLFAVFQEREQVVAKVRAAGAWGPLVIVLLAIAQTIIAPIPGQIVNFVAGYVYGLWPGMLYSWIGLVLGTAFAMTLARYAGRPLVERIIGRKALQTVDRAAAGRGLSFFFLFFLIPGLPDDVLCFVAGLTALPLRILVVISAVARVPGLLGSAWLGANASALPPMVWVLLGLAGIIFTYLVWRYGEQIQMRVMRWLSTF